MQLAGTVLYVEDVPEILRFYEAGAVSIRTRERMPWGQTVAFVRSKEGTFVGICSPLAPQDAHP